MKISAKQKEHAKNVTFFVSINYQFGCGLTNGMAKLLREKQMMMYFWIAFGSALGGMARYWCSGFVAHHIGETFPWGTFAVNVIGSFVIGFFATLTGPEGRLLVGGTTRQFVMTGICGGYTTFSSFSLQTLNLVREGDWLRAGGNIVLSIILCLIAVAVGHIAAASLNQLEVVR